MTESCLVLEKTYNIIATVFIDIEPIIICGVSIGQFETRATVVSVSLNIMSLYIQSIDIVPLTQVNIGDVAQQFPSPETPFSQPLAAMELLGATVELALTKPPVW